ncbi:transporter substrate-binding domain-containing protein [Magnetospira sp. QH-2]|uniref:transporter substrate-binding domain-containing protein n=1 Tax=Magnetospira sp. (strain QH-2) TaxID=1288970 RepID=UPI0003E816AC|nr:transporter substrate-binding domain-containing protein [Magnetospira sp. QH-2]CCQ75258.1 membrane protein of unknown function[Include bacterial extracellular solute-binding protein domain, PAS domain and SpoIIE similar domain] [Magnetospira sp. QH-2]
MVAVKNVKRLLSHCFGTFFLLTLFCVSLGAPAAGSDDNGQNAADKIASFASKAIYNLDEDQLVAVLESYLGEKPEVKALVVTESIDQEQLLTYYRDNEELVFGQPIPQGLLDLSQFTAVSSFDGEQVGTIKVFYSDASVVTLSAEERSWIAANPRIRVHNETDWPPFNFAVDGRPKGFSIDYMNLLAEKAGLNIEYVTGPTWNEFLEMMKQGDLEVMLNIVKTPERQKYLLYTEPYANNPNTILSKAETPYKTLQDLFDKTVSVPKGFFYEEILKRDYPEITVLPVDNTLDSMKAVQFGTADAAFGELAVFSHLMDEHMMSDLAVSGEVKLGDPEFALLNIATRKDLPILASILEKGVAAITKEERQLIQARWFKAAGESLQLDPRVTLTDEETAWLIDHQELRLGVDRAWPPYDLINENGRHDGISAEFLGLLAQRLGLRLKLQEDLTWSEVLQKAKNRQLDIISVCSATPEREKYLRFTETLATVPWVIVSRENSDLIKGPNDLLASRVAMVKGYAVISAMREKFPGLTVLEVDSPLAGLRAVLDGQVESYVGNLGVVDHLMRTQGLTNLHIVSHAGVAPAQLKICVRSDWPLLVSILNKGLATIAQSERKRILDAWISTDQTRAQVVDERDDDAGKLWGLIALAVGIFVALAVLVNRMMSSLDDERLARQMGSRKVRLSIMTGLGLLAMIVVVISWIVLDRNRVEISESIGTDLEAIHTSTVERLRLWAEQQKRIVEQVGNNQELVAITQRLLSIPAQNDELLRSGPLGEVRNFFARNEETLDTQGFFIIDRNHISIASRRDTNIGTINLIAEKRPKLLQKVFDGQTVFIPPLESDVFLDQNGQRASRTPPTMFFAAPVHGPQGRVIAVVTLRVDPGHQFSKVLQFGRMGESGESYAFDHNGLMLSRSRFEAELAELGLLDKGQSSMLNIMIIDPGRDLTRDPQATRQPQKTGLTRMAASAVVGRSGKDLSGYADYRGVPVLGVWTWLTDLELGLATEIDVNEAFKTYNILRWTVILIMGATLVLAVGATLFTMTLGERASNSLMRARDQLELRVEERTAELAESRALFQTVLDNLPGVVFLKTMEGRFQLVNRGYEEMYDIRYEEVRGKSLYDIYPNDLADKLSNFDRDAVQAGGLLEREHSIDKEGSEVVLQSSMFPVFDADGKMTAYGGIEMDITARKEAEKELAESEERIRLLMNSVGEGVFGVDLDGRITFVNPQATAMLGYTPEEMIGRQGHLLIHHSHVDGRPYPQEDCWMYKSFTEGAVYRIDDEVLWRKDDTAFEVEYHATPIMRGDEIMGAVVSFIDISARKAAERALEDAFEVISASIQYAARIQRSVLPDGKLMESLFTDHFVLWKPRDVVGGDIYWTRMWGDGLLVILADCTGHGVPGAFMTLISTGALDKALTETATGSVGDLVRRIHQLVQVTLGQHGKEGESDDGLELGACFLAPTMDTLVFAGARFELFVSDGLEVEIIRGTKSGIGYRGIPFDQEYRETRVDDVAGKSFYLTTDGMIDQVGGARGRMFGKKRFKSVLLEYFDKPMAVQRDHIHEALIAYQGDQRRRDDVAVIGFRV